MLSGLYEFPWGEEKLFLEQNPQDTNQEVSHVFSHFKLILHIYKIITTQISEKGKWVKVDDLAKYPFSTLMKKVGKKVFI